MAPWAETDPLYLPVGQYPVVEVLGHIPVLRDEVGAKLLPTGVEETEDHDLKMQQ